MPSNTGNTKIGIGLWRKMMSFKYDVFDTCDEYMEMSGEQLMIFTWNSEKRDELVL